MVPVPELVPAEALIQEGGAPGDRVRRRARWRAAASSTHGARRPSAPPPRRSTNRAAARSSCASSAASGTAGPQRRVPGRDAHGASASPKTASAWRAAAPTRQVPRRTTCRRPVGRELRGVRGTAHGRAPRRGVRALLALHRAGASGVDSASARSAWRKRKLPVAWSATRTPSSTARRSDSRTSAPAALPSRAATSTRRRVRRPPRVAAGSASVRRDGSHAARAGRAVEAVARRSHARLRRQVLRRRRDFLRRGPRSHPSTRKAGASA